MKTETKFSTTDFCFKKSYQQQVFVPLLLLFILDLPLCMFTRRMLSFSHLVLFPQRLSLKLPQSHNCKRQYRHFKSYREMLLYTVQTIPIILDHSLLSRYSSAPMLSCCGLRQHGANPATCFGVLSPGRIHLNLHLSQLLSTAVLNLRHSLLQG